MGLKWVYEETFSNLGSGFKTLFVAFKRVCQNTLWKFSLRRKTLPVKKLRRLHPVQIYIPGKEAAEEATKLVKEFFTETLMK